LLAFIHQLLYLDFVVANMQEVNLTLSIHETQVNNIIANLKKWFSHIFTMHCMFANTIPLLLFDFILEGCEILKIYVGLLQKQRHYTKQ